ncbi:MAG: uncharacterized protein H6R26_2150 [Proteobacteria bacterium]|nr:uncharacterized protein [Pseudomonadota bacterium]
MTTRLFYALIFSILACNTWAQTPQQRGEEIAREMDRRDEGFVNSVHEAAMTLKNRQGEESFRHFTLKTLEVTGDGDKEVGLFDNPPDVRGTAVLTYSHGLKPDDQWIYLPSLKRVKRISSANKSGPFVGSEFAFEDIASWQFDKFGYKYLKDQIVDGGDCFVLEFIPKYENSGYSKQIWYIDKGMYQARKVEFYDRKGALFKTLFLKSYHQYLGKHWRAHELRMENHQTGKTTWLRRDNYRFKTTLNEREFTEGTLTNVR